jgi:hypothetical protein
MRSMQSCYKEELNWATQSEESSFEMPACRDMSLGAEELNWVNNNGKKGIKWCKEDLHVIRSYSETVINLLQEYD